MTYPNALGALVGYLSENAERLSGLLRREDWKPSRAHIEGARNTLIAASNTLETALRAQSDVRAPTPQGEPVAWTNEAQLGFLKDPGCAEMPMAMWDKSSFYSQVPLYTAPVPPADLAEVLENVRVSIGKIADGRRGDGVPPELYRA